MPTSNTSAVVRKTGIGRSVIALGYYNLAIISWSRLQGSDPTGGPEVLISWPVFRSVQKRRASPAVGQLPSLTPNFLGPFTRRMLAANSGLSNPASAASYANRRTAASRPLIVDAARPRFSRKMRKRVTTTLLKESRGSEQYHLMNSSRLHVNSPV